MKKLILGSAILAVLGMSANAMAANSGTVQFSGSVTTATCNLNLQDSAGGSLTTVDVGSVAATAASGTLIDFKLVPQEPECLTKTGAAMTWTSPTLNPMGLGNSATNGTNAVLLLSAKNSTATGSNKNIKEGNTTFDYNVTGGIRSFDFQTGLAKPNTTTAFTAGIFTANASYVVAYK